jgi:hypothetical protein
MKNIFAQLHLSFSKINKTHIQLILAVLMLAMLVLGASAPEDFGGVGR